MLKRPRPLSHALALGFFTCAALAAVNGAARAGASFSVGDSDFYGRIDIGGYPPPPLIYPHPLIITPVPTMGPPIYLHVPLRHAKNWPRYCRRYNACAEPVYFVHDHWYQNEYAPRHTGYDLKPAHVQYDEEWRHMHGYHRWRGYRHLSPPRHCRDHDDDD